VDHLDALVVEQLVERPVGMVDIDPLGTLPTALQARPEQAVDTHADAAQGLDMDCADETAADHGRADSVKGPHWSGTVLL